MQAAEETLTICWSSPASTARCAPIPLPTSTPQMVSLLTRSCFTTPTIKMPESSTLGQRSRMRCWAPLVLAALRCGGSARHKCTCLKNPEVCNELEAIDRNAAAYDRGASFHSDTFRHADGTLPVDVSTIAHVSVTRVSMKPIIPGAEVLVPPRPGQPVRRADPEDRKMA